MKMLEICSAFELWCTLTRVCHIRAHFNRYSRRSVCISQIAVFWYHEYFVHGKFSKLCVARGQFGVLHDHRGVAYAAR